MLFSPRKTLALLWFLPCLLLACSGCGEKLAATISGNVTLNGAPLSTGGVSFNPVAGGPVATGTIQSDGSYSVQTGTTAGLPPGDYIVTVVATQPALPPANPSDPPQAPLPLSPIKYGDKATSDLKFAVKAGANRIDLPLKGP